MDVSDWTTDYPFQITVNGSVDNFNARLKYKTCGITLGENGFISNGSLWRPLHEELFFENAGPGQVMDNSRLVVLSRQSGQNIASILPPDDDLAAAAGLQDNGTAVMSVVDASLTAAEEAALDELTDVYGGTAHTVFDVSVKKYDAEGSFIENATELNSEVPIIVQNTTDSEVYVARLHEEENGLEAEKLTDEEEDETIRFNSNLFSKHVLVKADSQSFEEPDITVEYDLNDNSVLISFPWADTANYHEISVYQADGTSVFSSIWDERSEAPACMFHVNIVQDGQNRLLAPGEYYAVIVLKGKGYAKTVFRKDFTVFESLPDFSLNTLLAYLTKIEEEAFAGVNVTQAAIPELCTEIGKKAFDGSAHGISLCLKAYK